MRTLTYRGKKKARLSKFLESTFPELTYGYLRLLLRTKNVKINDAKISEDTMLSCGDRIDIYADENKLLKYSYTAVYSDANILAAVKPRGISSEDFCKRISGADNAEYRLGHRLDTNTNGVILLAKNAFYEKELFAAFKSGAVKKSYIALLAGEISAPLKLTAYLSKDSENGTVEVFDERREGTLTIRTDVSPVAVKDGLTLAEITLHTGRTHQIRAHLAHIGHPVVGDGKYGDFDINRTLRAKKQLLTAHKISFSLPAESKLAYLNDKVFECPPDFNL